jgi:asparagine synthase (glutamine-hydrolysing)
MCGITGIIRWAGQPVTGHEIKAINASIKHRGPDGEGIFVKEPVALGHQRLSIIDLATGAQPMQDASGLYTIVFNGEVYNYKDLKDELKSLGHHFVTTSDTEVVLYAYIQWGKECLNKLRGMFAIGIDDRRLGKLFLARDHFGIKPLLYRLGNGYLAFSSELPALLKVEDKEPLSGSLQAIDYYLRFQYIPAPYTIYKQVHKLMAGHFLEISYEGRVKGPEPYWQFSWQQEERNRTEADWIEEAEAVLAESVKAHLVADVPFGVYLSGGIDSTLMAWEMKKQLDIPLKAFSIGFDDPLYSELPFARIAAQKLGVDLITEIITDKSLYQLPDILAHFGEPYGDSSVIPTWHVSKLARAHVPMVISGDGGDELFGGYGSYLAYYAANPIQMADAFHPGKPLKALRRSLRANLKKMTGQSLNDLQRWYGIIGYVSDQQRFNLWQSSYHKVIREAQPFFEKLASQVQNEDQYRFAQYLDIQTYMTFDILPKVDIASMYHGLEVRPPMIDVRVANLAARLPFEMKLGLSDGKPTGKYLLKKVLGKAMPEDFVFRKKQGFAIPRDKWLEKGNIGYHYFREQVLDSTGLIDELFDKQVLEDYFKQHSRENDHSNMLWLFLCLGIWSSQNPGVKFS